MQTEHPLDRNIERGFLLDLANQASLETFSKREMPAGQVPTPRTIRHPGRAHQHEDPPAICNTAVDANIELLLRHRDQINRAPRVSLLAEIVERATLAVGLPRHTEVERMKKSEFYRDARRDLTGPLDGIRVLEATTSWAGPMCACILADLGADVIKIEAREGEVAWRIPPALPGHETQIGFAQATVNRNKRNLTLDLRTDEGREIFLKLAARADIIVQNFRPGTFVKWGIGYEHVRAVKPDIIYVSISGYGQFGPIHDRVAYDPLAQAMSGFVSLGGSPDGPPPKAPTWICDDLGGLHGAIGALAALRHRDRTGEGQHIDVAMLDAMLFQSNGYLTLAAMNIELARSGNEIPFSVPTNTYQCRDALVMAGVLLHTHSEGMGRLAGAPP